MGYVHLWAEGFYECTWWKNFRPNEEIQASLSFHMIENVFLLMY